MRDDPNTLALAEQLGDIVERIGHAVNELRRNLPDPDDDPLLPPIERLEALVLEAINVACDLRDLQGGA